MGMTDVNVEKLSTEVGIKIGDADAPIKVIEFINIRCPYCKQWFDEKNDLLQEYVNAGKIERIIKLFDKEKPALAKGNIMHHHIPNDASAMSAIKAIYDTQDIWGDLEDHTEIAMYAQNTLGLSLQEDETMYEAIIEETQEANVFFIPTVIIGNEIFDQKITNDELKALLDA
ncbi:thioredoxin domain-containing protein [Vagococcus fluvialis]|uniref:thioredoxin domain-containing protein n=1 Tax=Vagococcus fluvialis TaxID=2738 RepID=UPI003B5A73A4